MRTRIKDVATKAGVTPIVVSRVLHDRARNVGVSDATAERVRTVAAELGYRVNVTARQFRSRHTHTIGILNGIGCPRLRFDSRSRYFAALIDGIVGGAFAHGYSVQICPRLFGENPLDALSEGGFDGFVLYSSSPSACCRALSAFTGPLVLIHTQSRHICQRIPSVSCDNDQGLGFAVDHLVELGHRRIAFSHFSGARFGEVSPQLDSIRTHLARHGLGCTESDFIDAGAEGQGVRDYFARSPRHTAVICVSDSVADEFLLHSRQTGVRVPEDFSVIGFDSRSYCEELTPRLTSVSQPLELMGRKAVDLLVRCIGREFDIPSLLIPCSLDIRDSTLSVANKEIIS